MGEKHRREQLESLAFLQGRKKLGISLALLLICLDCGCKCSPEPEPDPNPGPTAPSNTAITNSFLNILLPAGSGVQSLKFRRVP